MRKKTISKIENKYKWELFVQICFLWLKKKLFIKTILHNDPFAQNTKRIDRDLSK